MADENSPSKEKKVEKPLWRQIFQILYQRLSRCELHHVKFYLLLKRAYVAKNLDIWKDVFRSRYETVANFATR